MNLRSMAWSLVGVVAIVCILTGPRVLRWWRRETGLADLRICQGRLIAVDVAKEQFARVSNATNGTLVKWSDIQPFLQEDVAQLKCPSGASYRINPIGVDPSCGYTNVVVGHKGEAFIHALGRRSLLPPPVDLPKIWYTAFRFS